jgi:L-aminopeptidase/D-esterase-like protein
MGLARALDVVDVAINAAAAAGSEIGMVGAGNGIIVFGRGGGRGTLLNLAINAGDGSRRNGQRAII